MRPGFGAIGYRRPMADAGPWRNELVDVARAASGGLLFGVPLLYTMEIWWVGTRARPGQMLVLLGALAVPVMLLNLKSGFRDTRDHRLSDAAGDTVEALAIGLIVTLGVLVLLREVRLDTPVTVALGKVVYESVPFCLGIGVARFLLEGDSDLDDDTTTTSNPAAAARWTPPIWAPPRSVPHSSA